jgi:hypothetical protein
MAARARQKSERMIKAGGGPPAAVLPGPSRFPRWLMWLVGLLILGAVLGWLGSVAYGALDRVYAQEVWRYYRPQATTGAGTVLYRDLDGQLFIAALDDLDHARRLTAAAPGGSQGGAEIVRDAVALPGGRAVAYYATERRAGQAASDRLKVVGLDGTLQRDIAVTEAAGEPILSSIYVSSSGRYLALTSRDRARVYFYDVAAGGTLVLGQADAPPEPVQWYRNGDLRTAPFAGQPAYALSPDGKRRAQVRDGVRRAPACNETSGDPGAGCEAVQELAVAPQTATGLSRAGFALHAAFSDFSADGWGPVPAQPSASFYGRLVWSPDGTQLLFTTLDGAESRVYAIGADGRTRPRLVIEGAEALDWVP